jgi:hypothetical protein
MVFARSKIMIHDYCFEEKPVALTLNYTGPNPQLAVKKYIEILKLIFKVHDSDIQEKIFNWDRSGKEERFEIEYEVRKDYDKNTYLFIQGTLDGTIKPSEEFGKEGRTRIRIRGAIRAEYPQDTFWQKSLLYELVRVFYHKIIYSSNWEKYMHECREELKMFMEEMKGFLNLLQRGGM